MDIQCIYRFLTVVKQSLTKSVDRNGTLAIALIISYHIILYHITSYHITSYHITSYHIIRQAESDKTLCHYSGHTLFTLFLFPSLSLSLSLSLSALCSTPSPCHYHSHSLPLHLPLLVSHSQPSLLPYHYRTIKCKQFNITTTTNTPFIA